MRKFHAIILPVSSLALRWAVDVKLAVQLLCNAVVCCGVVQSLLSLSCLCIVLLDIDFLPSFVCAEDLARAFRGLTLPA